MCRNDKPPLHTQIRACGGVLLVVRSHRLPLATTSFVLTATYRVLLGIVAKAFVLLTPYRAVAADLYEKLLFFNYQAKPVLLSTSVGKAILITATIKRLAWGNA
jgi:hypothetical protein